jgi:hypothetical protein
MTKNKGLAKCSLAKFTPPFRSSKFVKLSGSQCVTEQSVTRAQQYSEIVAVLLDHIRQINMWISFCD